MKQQIQQLLHSALKQWQKTHNLELPVIEEIQVERARNAAHGDFASNIAMILAKTLQKKPRECAEQLIACLPTAAWLARAEIAGPGFINFYLSPSALQDLMQTILNQSQQYGRGNLGQGKKLHLEFVSSNPTGPLHVGHGRQAAYGAVLGNLLDAAGFKVHREYYVNDAGRQMDILATSMWLRYLEIFEIKINFPRNGYKGDYVRVMAEQLKQQYDKKLLCDVDQLFKELPQDETDDGQGDKEAHIDALIVRAKKYLGDHYRQILDLALNSMVDNMRQDLMEFGVTFDRWFSERSLQENGAFQRAISQLNSAGLIYQKEGATWFKASDFGDDKDRVVLRENGLPTYFATDIAYHYDKFQRGFDRAIDVLGADHHGYAPRIKAILTALGIDANKLDVTFIQFVSLFRGKERLPMSTRSGSFVTLRELREEVGNDAARYFYVMRKAEQPLDFDLELARSKSNENPVYYIQYAHARIASVFRQWTEQGGKWNDNLINGAIEYLTQPEERALLTELMHYPMLIEAAARQYEPHLLANYMRDLAQSFHVYYNAHAFLVEDQNCRHARLALIYCARQVLANGLNLLGVSAPEKM